MTSNTTLASALQVVGVATTLYAGFKCINGSLLWLLPKLPLTRYQSPKDRSWALVTGASAGIGFGFAQELAARGFNVVILGHKPDELAAAQATINAESPAVEVQILELNVVTATAVEIETALESISQLRLTILVNVCDPFDSTDV